MRIIDMPAGDGGVTRQAAELLVEGFREQWPTAWPTLESALEEVREALEPGKICRVAVEGEGDAVTVLGWVGGIPHYGGNVFELHPLVVRSDRQRLGVGRALVEDLEARVRERGGLTITVGTDDESDATSLSGVDLYADVPGAIAGAWVVTRHPMAFYRKMGFVITGVVPDANGRGKPDILMSKPVH